MVRSNEYIPPINPKYEERLKMLKIALEEVNRPEDFDNLVELLAPPIDITNINSTGKCKGIKVGIIGGGVAGLASAFELRKLGFNITIFETEYSRIGGRIYTYYFDKRKKLYGELGAMRIPISHETVWHYIDLFKLKTRPFIQNDENTFIYVRNKRARNDLEGKSVMEKIYPEFNLTPEERRTPWQEMLKYTLSRNLLKISPSIRKELIEIKENYNRILEYFDSLNIREVFEEMGLSKGAIDMLSGVNSFLGNFYYNSYFENLQDEYTVNYAYRYEIVNGYVKIPLAFYNSLMEKDPKEYSNIKAEDLGKVFLKNGKTVIGIYKSDKNNKVVLRYKDERTLEVKNEEFDFVICTIPFSSLRNVEIYPMFSNEKMQAIKELNYASIQKTAFVCKERFWQRGGPHEKIIGGGSYTDEVVGSIWYPFYDDSRKIENRKKFNKKKNYRNNRGILLSSYNLNQDAIRLGNLEESRRFELIKRQVENVHGLQEGELDSIVEDYKTVLWDKEKGFYGGVCYNKPGQQKLFLYASAKPEYDNRVYFAGEHVSVSHGWVQGALSSAMKAANDIAEYCKVMSSNSMK
ncbi:flavin monoamine oxidase family protein [Clostridium sp.]|uniref:flavin monoamine oxidase family protein n=1 Tax=Clostridium sp. TaxID=1506 RepID=UPI0037BF3A50